VRAQHHNIKHPISLQSKHVQPIEEAHACELLKNKIAESPRAIKQVLEQEG
jgi:hypothetical protein